MSRGSSESVEEPVEGRVPANGIELAYFERHRALRGAGPTLLFVHATGFHARCWDPVIRRIGARHSIAVDQRGHGRTAKAEIENWSVFGSDLADFVRALDLRDVVGVGHSMGGHALVDAAASEPERFRRLILIDPVIAAPGSYVGGGWAVASSATAQHPTARRKRSFRSPREMIERFRDRVPYRVFTDEALQAYCEHGLLPVEAGEGYVLACPPEVEASIYMTSRSNAAIHERVRALDLPVLVVRAKLPPPDRGGMDFSSSPTWTDLASAFRDGRDRHFPEHTHFLPMEIPETIAELVVGEIEDPGGRGQRPRGPAPVPRPV